MASYRIVRIAGRSKKAITRPIRGRSKALEACQALDDNLSDGEKRLGVHHEMEESPAAVVSRGKRIMHDKRISGR